MNDSTIPTSPNAALGHVTDTIGDLESFPDEQINDAGRRAAADADLILRDAMGEPVAPSDLIAIARRCIEAAIDGRSAMAGSIYVPIDAHRDTGGILPHVAQLGGIAAALVRAEQGDIR